MGYIDEPELHGIHIAIDIDEAELAARARAGRAPLSPPAQPQSRPGAAALTDGHAERGERPER
jgi:hypothetical protein